MKRTIFGSLAVLVSLAVGSTVNGQYGSTQSTLLPQYPTTNYNNMTSPYQGSPAQHLAYRQDGPAPGPLGQPAIAPAVNHTIQNPVQNFSAPLQTVPQGSGTYTPPGQGAPTPAFNGVPQGAPAVNGAPAYGGAPVYGGAPAYSGPTYNAPVQSYPSGPVNVYGQGGYGCDTGSYIGAPGVGSAPPVYQSVVAPNSNVGCAPAPMYAPAYAQAPAYAPAAAFAPARSKQANWIVGSRALIFNRDFEDDYSLSANPSGDYLFSTDADSGTFGGVEGVIGRRGCNGKGWEFRYWGLFPSDARASISGSPVYSNLRGLDYLNYDPYNALQVYNFATTHQIVRRNDFHNFELNFLKNAGCACGFLCKCLNIELLAGVRYFRFDESFRYSAFSNDPAYPEEFRYDLDVENDLVGFQLGARTEHCISKKLRFNTGTKFGIYNNNISARQSIQDNFGNYAYVNSGPFTGRDFTVSSDKNDVAFLGEFDFGASYQISCRTRLTAGYRVLAVSGVALAPGQIPFNFSDSRDTGRIRSNHSLILHGAYFGADFCF